MFDLQLIPITAMHKMFPDEVPPVEAMFAIVDTSAEASGVLERPDFDRIDQYIVDQMADCRIPGLSLGIIKEVHRFT